MNDSGFQSKSNLNSNFSEKSDKTVLIIYKKFIVITISNFYLIKFSKTPTIPINDVSKIIRSRRKIFTEKKWYKANSNLRKEKYSIQNRVKIITNISKNLCKVHQKDPIAYRMFLSDKNIAFNQNKRLVSQPPSSIKVNPSIESNIKKKLRIIFYFKNYYLF